MIRFLLTCLFLSAGFLNNIKAQDIFSVADSLFSVGKYSHAALEYERIIFQSSSVQLQNNAILKKSYCNKNEGIFEKSLETLSRINLNNVTDSLRIKILYEIALNAYLDSKFLLAANTVQEAIYYTKDTASQNNLLFLKILALLEMENWEEVLPLLKQYLIANNITENHAELFKSPQQKKLTSAKILSYIIPGSGQIYAGHPARGLSSILLQSAFIAASIWAFLNTFYIAGIIYGASTFFALYTGGAKYAQTLALNGNQKKINAYKQSIKDLVLQTEENKISINK